MRFIEFVFKNVLRRKVRSLLTGIGVAVAMAAVVGLLGVAQGFEGASREMLENHGVDIIVGRKGLGQAATGRLDESIARQLGALPNVAEVAPILTDRVSLNNIPLGVPLLGAPPDSFVLKKLAIQPGGRLLRPDDKSGVLLGTTLAKNLDKQVGDTVEIELKKFKVIGIYQSTNMFEKNGAIALLSSLQELMDRRGQISEFQIVMTSDLADKGAAVKQLQTAIEGLQGPEGKPYGLGAKTTEEYVKSGNEVRLSAAMAWMTSAIALVIGAVGMLNTMIMSVMERTQEIGILRAIGWPKRRIIRMVLAESFVLSVTGAIFGIGAAMLLTRLLSLSPAATNLIEPSVPSAAILIGLLLSLVVGLVGGAYPAYRGASLPPTEALRYE